MRRDTAIIGTIMLLVGIGVGYIIAMGRLFLDTRDTIREIAADVASANSDVKVRVMAKQFTWHFHYPGDDGVFGATAIGAITEDNDVGLDMRDPASADDFVTDELVLPCRTTVGLIVTSADVIHALGQLEGDFEQDAIPGADMTKALTTPRTPRVGQLRCVQVCGAGHVDHLAPYRFITQSKFDSWSSEQSAIATESKKQNKAEMATPRKPSD